MSPILALLAITASHRYWGGVDASFVPQYRDLKTQFFIGEQAVDPLAALAKAGANLLRLRVWVNPEDGYCDIAHTLALAAEGKRRGMDLLLDFHYSDTWADPQHQITPKGWAKMSLPELERAVARHSEEVVRRLAKQGTSPTIVQVGNEVRNGMLWPIGRLTKGPASPNFDAFAALVRAGIRGTRNGLPKGAHTMIMIHHDQGGRLEQTAPFFAALRKRGVRFDMIGLSYYPWWHGSLEDLRKSVNGLATRFGTPVMVVETAYPFTLKWQDSTGNFVGEERQLLPGYPATPEGQASYLRELHRIVRSAPKGLGAGVVYWAPEYVATKGLGTPYENLTLFDFEHRLLEGARALAPFSTTGDRQTSHPTHEN